MTPKYGGGPDLPPAPDCLPGSHGEANRYAARIKQALDTPGWSVAQRRHLRDKYRKWLLRAEGRDPYFEQYGTFPRFDGTAPPTSTDLVVARWRKRFPRSKQERRLRTLPKNKHLAIRKAERAEDSKD